MGARCYRHTQPMRKATSAARSLSLPPLVRQGSLLNYVATVKLYEVTLGAPSGGPATLVDFNGTFDTDPHVRPAEHALVNGQYVK